MVDGGEIPLTAPISASCSAQPSQLAAVCSCMPLHGCVEQRCFHLQVILGLSAQQASVVCRFLMVGGREAPSTAPASAGMTPRKQVFQCLMRQLQLVCQPCFQLSPPAM